MKISFICASLEPGRDGVGDYVRRFAAALDRAGHACQAIAIADPYVDSGRAETLDGHGQALRLPYRDWLAGRLAGAADALAGFAPDWVSLQMVCYAYAQRGLLVAAPRRLAALDGFGRRHLMLHELWVGAVAGESARTRVVGALQSRLLLRTIGAWRASRVHTSNGVYRELLARHGVAANELGLPSNIPIVPVPSAEEAQDEAAAHCGLVGVRRDTVLLVGVFGQVHAGWIEHAALEGLATAARRAGRRLVLVQLGRAGRPGREYWLDLARSAGDLATFVELGELDAPTISRLLQGIDIGLATSPWALTGKSGTVAALLEHGLPVVVPRTEWRLRTGPTPEPAAHPRLHRLDSAFLERVATGTLARDAPAENLEPYQRFIHSLASPG